MMISERTKCKIICYYFAVTFCKKISPLSSFVCLSACRCIKTFICGNNELFVTKLLLFTKICLHNQKISKLFCNIVLNKKTN